MNVPNALTVIRIFLTFVFLSLVFYPGPGFKFAALIIFMIAAYTDYLDGRLARKHQLITPFGKLMDPIADKILVFGAYLSFVVIGVVPLWIVLVMLARELLVTGLRLWAARRGQVVSAQASGKHKTVLQLLSILAVLLLLIAREIPAGASFVEPGFWIVTILLYAALVSTLYSGARLIVDNRKILL